MAGLTPASLQFRLPTRGTPEKWNPNTVQSRIDVNRTGPTMQQVLEAGGTWNSTPQIGRGAGSFEGQAGTSSYSMPLGFPTPASLRGGSAARPAARAAAPMPAPAAEAPAFEPSQMPRQVKYDPSQAAVPDPQAAQRAAFSAAKSRAGNLARSSLETLRAELAERGILGGGTEAQGIADSVVRGTQPLLDLNVAQQGESLDIAKQERGLGEARANTIYQGGIAQRGQDINALQTNDARKMQAILAGLRTLY